MTIFQSIVLVVLSLTAGALGVHKLYEGRDRVIVSACTGATDSPDYSEPPTRYLTDDGRETMVVCAPGMKGHQDAEIVGKLLFREGG